MNELQTLITQAKDFAADIEEMMVDHAYKAIEIEELDTAVGDLTTKKEDLDEKKKKKED